MAPLSPVKLFCFVNSLDTFLASTRPPTWTLFHLRTSPSVAIISERVAPVVRKNTTQPRSWILPTTAMINTDNMVCMNMVQPGVDAIANGLSRPGAMGDGLTKTKAAAMQCCTCLADGARELFLQPCLQSLVPCSCRG